MPIPIFNSVASFFLKRRISQIELFKDYPIEVQQEVLRKLVVYSIDTEIGKKFEFKTIRHYNDFKERVPIVAYEDIYEDIERNRKGEQNIFWRTPIKWFAKSSGTTNAKSKFIPITKESLTKVKKLLDKFITQSSISYFLKKCIDFNSSFLRLIDFF